MHRYCMAEPIWRGETGFIIAGGPSLCGFDFSRLAGRKVMAINSSVFSYPAADVLFFGDARWWAWNAKQVRKDYKGLIFTCSESEDPRINNLVKIRPPPHLSTDRGQVTMQRTSLTAAINLSVHFGCARIVLMGVDQKAGADGRTHHHEPHPVPSLKNCYDIQSKELREMAKSVADLGVEIINTSLGSRIDWWPKQPIEELL
jgi:hypothetical protein